MSGPDVTRRTLLKYGVSIPALAAFLSSCGGGNTGSLGSSSDQPTLSVATNQSPWLSSYQKIVEVYQQETGRRVELRIFPFAGLLTQQINAIQNRSNAFDIFQVNEGWTGQFYDNEWLIPLREVDSGFEWDPQVISYDAVGRWDAKQRITSEDGEPLALPMNGNIHVFTYRKDIYDKLGLEPPATFDDAVANGRRAQAEGLVKYGYTSRGQGDIGGYAATFDFGPLLHGYGGDWFVAPGEDWTPRINDAAGQAAMEKFLELLSLGPAQPQSIGQVEMQSLMQSGEALQAHMVTATAFPLDDPKGSRVVDKIGYAVVPAGGAGVVAPMSGTWVLGIPTGLPEDRQQAAMHFLDWLMSKDAQMRWAELGNTVTRQDVYESDLAEEKRFRYMAAVAASTPDVHPGIRYPFSQQMLQTTERWITEIVSDQLTVTKGLDLIATEINKAAQDAGFR
jgi:multiple sugar transport system substrate-binding protein